jgi:hypothetical protein
VVYCSKYSGKPQKPLDNVWVQMITANFAKKFVALRMRHGDVQTMSSEERERYVHGLLRSIAWMLTKADEIDPQMIVYNLQYGSPYIASHEFVRVNVGRFMKCASNMKLEVELEHNRANGKWVPSQDPTLDYLLRPAEDKDMPMLIFYMTRILEYAAPRFSRERFQQNHPNVATRRLKPKLRFPVLYPSRPNIFALATRAPFYWDHSNCTRHVCKKVKYPSVAYQTTLVEEEDDVDLEGTESEFQEPGFEIAEEQCPFDLNDLQENVEDDRAPYLNAADNDSVDTSMENRTSLLGKTDDETRDIWGLFTSCILNTYSKHSDHRICVHEASWDAANRIIRQLIVQAEYDPNAKLLLKMLLNMAELDRTKDDYEKRREQQKQRDKDISASYLAKRQESIDNNDYLGENDEDVTSLRAVAEAEIYEMEMEMFEAQAAEKQEKNLVGARKIVAILKPELIRTTHLSQTPTTTIRERVDVVDIYKREKARELGGEPLETSIIGHDPSITFVAGDISGTTLKRVAEKFGLRYEQRIAFFLVGYKLIQALFPDRPPELLPFILPEDFKTNKLRMIVTGQGGTGKSQVIQALKYLSNVCDRPHAVKTLAYVGVAAANAG